MAFILVLVLLAALCVSGVAILMFRPAQPLSQTDLQPRFPIARPFEVLISCEVYKQHGWTWYGGDAPIRALFAGCKPQGDFYLVGTPSTPEEACAARNQPEVAFLLTGSGDVTNVALTRSSGSSSVDQKVLQLVRDSRNPATKCGECAVFAKVPVSLNCRQILNITSLSTIPAPLPAWSSTSDAPTATGPDTAARSLQ